MSQWWAVGPLVAVAVLYVLRAVWPRTRRAGALNQSGGCHDCAAPAAHRLPGGEARRTTTE